MHHTFNGGRFLFETAVAAVILANTFLEECVASLG
jgi:hypothetical protein